MKIAYNWLKDFVNFDWNPQDLAKKLTQTGLEVEKTESFSTIEGGLEGVVVGHVLEVNPHPDADRLRVCKVDVGEDNPLEIVCGAPNIAVGQKVPVATVGSTLYPIEGDPFKIKKSKIRGIASFGMICAEDELGLGKGHDGIMVLNADLKEGVKMADSMDLGNDIVFEIGLTPNRADSMSHFGASRDVAALLGEKATPPKVIDKVNSGTFDSPISVKIEDQNKCLRYSGVFIRGVKVGPSPDWIQNRLKSIGLRPKNNIVDITNYVMHELGQPLHAFDATEIKSSAIVVKTLAQDVKFVTLEGETREIKGGIDLMICDGDNPLAIGGVMGGLDSGVSDTTVDIFLESAYFEPVAIRKTSHRLGMKTDSSYRFERGTDPNNTLFAAKRAASLILEFAGGEISEFIDEGQAKFESFTINFSLEYLNNIAGHSFEIEEVEKILNLLDIRTTKEGTNITAIVPPYRVDVKRPQDLAEEVLRIYGYNNIKVSNKAWFSLFANRERDSWSLKQKLANFLASSGYREILTNSLVPESRGSENSVKIVNSLSTEMSVMRTNLWESALDVIEYNQNRGKTDLRIFEFGKIFWREEDQKISEKEQLGIFICGKDQPLNWKYTSKETDIFNLVSLVDQLKNLFELKLKISELEDDQVFDYGLSFSHKGKLIAKVGKLSEKNIGNREIRNTVFGCLVEWATLAETYIKTKVSFKPIPKFPGTSRDVSLIVPRNLHYVEIKKAIHNCNPNLIREIRLTDVYKGDNIEAGKTSYLIGMEIRDDNKTLTDSAVDKIMGKVFDVLENKLGAEIRR